MQREIYGRTHSTPSLEISSSTRNDVDDDLFHVPRFSPCWLTASATGVLRTIGPLCNARLNRLESSSGKGYTDVPRAKNRGSVNVGQGYYNLSNCPLVSFIIASRPFATVTNCLPRLFIHQCLTLKCTRFLEQNRGTPDSLDTQVPRLSPGRSLPRSSTVSHESR